MVHAPVHASHSRLARSALDLCQWGSGVTAKNALDKSKETNDGRWRAFLSELSGGWTKWMPSQPQTRQFRCMNAEGKNRHQQAHQLTGVLDEKELQAAPRAHEFGRTADYFSV
jgi:hypothetical protein